MDRFCTRQSPVLIKNPKSGETQYSFYCPLRARYCHYTSSDIFEIAGVKRIGHHPEEGAIVNICQEFHPIAQSRPLCKHQGNRSIIEGMKIRIYVDSPPSSAKSSPKCTPPKQENEKDPDFYNSFDIYG
ncbi:hypothetical protein HYW76_05340 [Candidatus Pacearchaeota archaeon]|nr:hypothetical protein [Candidatus Pacearchaeota archaeon]